MANAKKEAPRFKEWKRSNPGVKRVEQFMSNSAKYAVTHHYDSVSKSLFALDIVCRSRAKSDKTNSFDFDEVIGAVEKELADLANEICAKNEQINTLLTSHKINDLVEYENPWSREFIIKTPQSFIALKMFTDFDKLNTYLDTAYLYGLTGKVTVDEISYKIANQFKELARSLYVRSTNALRQLRESREANVAAGDTDPSNHLVLAELAAFESGDQEGTVEVEQDAQVAPVDVAKTAGATDKAEGLQHAS